MCPVCNLDIILFNYEYQSVDEIKSDLGEHLRGNIFPMHCDLSDLEDGSLKPSLNPSENLSTDQFSVRAFVKDFQRLGVPLNVLL